MNTINQNYLVLSWSTSRGRDTYGYNICRLDDNNTDKRYKCNGGGYDMVGTVVADWLKDAYQAKLLANHKAVTDLYGAAFYGDKITIDGACGLESVIQIAKAIGVNITSNYNRRKNRTEGFFVSENEIQEIIA